jgi:hypothetical protein
VPEQLLDAANGSEPSRHGSAHSNGSHLRRHEIADAADARLLRGIPVLAKGGRGGAMNNTRPDVAILREP